MSLQQVDLCEQTLEAACRGPVCSACTAEKQVGLFLWETIVVSKLSITFASRMRPPSDMLSGPAADLTVKEFGYWVEVLNRGEHHPHTFSLI